MRRKTVLFAAAILTMSLLSACGGSDKSASANAGKSGNTKTGKGEVTWSWGTLRGLYGDAEVTMNEDGGRESVVMKYPNGSVYRQIEYDYEISYQGSVDSAAEKPCISGKMVYPVSKTTKDAGGNPLYSWNYDWAACQLDADSWGAGVASDITPILEAAELADKNQNKVPEERYYSSYEYGYDYEKEEPSGNVSYQEMSHLIQSGQYIDVYLYGNGYWLTERVDGNPAKTWFYGPDGRLDEDLTITWNYNKGKPESLQLGQYSMYIYQAEVSDDGRTVTYTLDQSHTGEGDAKEGEKAEKKDLEQMYSFTLKWQEDGKPAEYRYNYSKEFMNTSDPDIKEYKISYRYENGVLAGAEYLASESGKNQRIYTITCNADGLLETEDYLRSSIGAGDVGAKAYTYHDNGVVESMTAYGDFTTEDPERIRYVRKYSEEGWLCAEALHEDEVVYENSYFENGDMAGKTIYKNGHVDTAYTYNENGVYTSFEDYRDDGTICRSGEMTGENEFTMYGYKQDDENTKYKDVVYVYGETDFEKIIYNEDGSVSSTATYPYHDGKNHQ